MFAEQVYEAAQTQTGKKKLDFASDEDDDDDDAKHGIFCDDCGEHIASGKIYHCPHDSHQDGYDLCLKCSKRASKAPPKLTSYDLEGVAEFIRSGRCRRICILRGAGISRSAGS